MAKKKQRNLVIVESPAKARTLAGLLGPEYDVLASVGHVRDLPKTKLGVDIDDGFQARYVVPREKQRVVQQLKAAAQLRAATGLKTPDALQLAAALGAGCRSFLTNDRRLPAIPGLRVMQLSQYA